MAHLRRVRRIAGIAAVAAWTVTVAVLIAQYATARRFNEDLIAAEIAVSAVAVAATAAYATTVRQGADADDLCWSLGLGQRIADALPKDEE